MCDHRVARRVALPKEFALKYDARIVQYAYDSRRHAIIDDSGGTHLEKIGEIQTVARRTDFWGAPRLLSK